MSLPFFYIASYTEGNSPITLDEDTSRHVVQVLRMKIGERIHLTNGEGTLLTCQITDDHKKHTQVTVENTTQHPTPARSVTVAISLLKNTNRFEWFLEKATEMGVRSIIPLICERTEKEKFRTERLQGICISAMLQSQQTWLPVLQEPVPFEKIEQWKTANGTNFIAHCMPDQKQSLTTAEKSAFTHSLICIGPEGDFTSNEVALALQQGFIPVSLGETRLRTETAGMVAAALLCNL
ncbi:MAG: RsmE family RNA methyltransferase [Bacteroidetes bacterium]|nr:RsmE family RNA methyltransferase [Bacteroidota bacterium]